MRRITVRLSSVHGRGVFALKTLQAGERVVEYKGRVISWRQAIRQHAHAGTDGHTFYFGLSDGRVIDGGRGGNSARWLNHACSANCEAVEEGGRVYVHTRSDVPAGAELFLDYALELDGPVTDDVSRQYLCRCGASDCRGTMLGGVNAR